MKINLNQVPNNYEGEPLQAADEKNPLKNEKGEFVYEDGKQVFHLKPLTYRVIFSIALNTWLKDEQPTAEDKGKIYQLSTKIYSSDEPDFTVDDLAFIKERVGKVHNALIYGRVSDLLEPK